MQSDSCKPFSLLFRLKLAPSVRAGLLDELARLDVHLVWGGRFELSGGDVQRFQIRRRVTELRREFEASSLDFLLAGFPCTRPSPNFRLLRRTGDSYSPKHGVTCAWPSSQLSESAKSPQYGARSERHHYDCALASFFVTSSGPQV
jgi:hypothetical protein